MGEQEKKGAGRKEERKGNGRRGTWDRGWGRGKRKGVAWEQGLEFETQVNGRVSQIGGRGGLGEKVSPLMDANNDGLSMVGAPDSA